MESFPYLFFDLDNTLLDFHKASEASFFGTSIKFGLERYSSELYSSFTKISAKLWESFEAGKVDRSFLRVERFRRTFLLHNISEDPILFGKEYLNGLCEQSFFEDQALEVAQRLKHAGHRLTLITNGLEEVQSRRLKKTGLDQIFELCFCSSESLPPKPFPDLYKAAHEAVGSPDKSLCLMIGDNIVCDVLGANKFGFKSCWYNPKSLKKSTEIHPHYEIEHLLELENLLDFRQ